jgi:hypothetical protein
MMVCKAVEIETSQVLIYYIHYVLCIGTTK